MWRVLLSVLDRAPRLLSRLDRLRKASLLSTHDELVPVASCSLSTLSQLVSAGKSKDHFSHRNGESKPMKNTMEWNPLIVFFTFFYIKKKIQFAKMDAHPPKKMLFWVSWYPNLYWWSCCLSVTAGGRCFARSKHRPLSSTSEKPCAQWVFWCLLRLVFEEGFITLARKSLISGIVSYVCMYIHTHVFVYMQCSANVNVNDM